MRDTFDSDFHLPLKSKKKKKKKKKKKIEKKIGLVGRRTRGGGVCVCSRSPVF